MKLIIDDGFRADLVKDAFFEGAMEIPIIKNSRIFLSAAR